ncbi:hypothetical protein B0J12DRAFT_735604 [Macrophomina phaseolina]|uniref:Uncharacterized protein n=1 Tax=Macrophomina phaseolina TaxID=35725 RepID=A0ABQ8GT94_9PEZI|nr:hypothetical protein B0J12DRAFT_735604 [Macrophomina phaseolina]
MAAAILEAPLPSVHHCTHPLNAAHLGLFADPWNSPFHNFRLPEPFPPTTSSTFSSAPIAIATDDTSHPSEMPPKGPPPSSPAVPRTLSHPPRLRAKPTSPVDVQGKLVRRRPATYVDRVAKLRNPSVAVTNAGPTSTPSEGRTTRSTANHESPQLQAPVGSSLVTRRRRRSPNPDFTPPRLRRTQPEGLWAPLTGNARAVAAAFRERSPIPSRRSVLPPDAPAPSGSSHPVPTAPRPRMMRRASSYSEREAENGGRTTSWDETAASWRGDSDTLTVGAEAQVCGANLPINAPRYQVSPDSWHDA